MVSESLKKIAAIVFATHPNEDCFHFTSDGNAFTDDNEHRAQAHARTLSDDTVTTVLRSDVPGKVTKAVDSVNADQSSASKQSNNTVINDAAADEKVLKASLKPIYIELFGKNPAPQYNSAKLQELITEQQVKNTTEAAAIATQKAEGTEGDQDTQ